MDYSMEMFENGLCELKIDLSADQKDQFMNYYIFLIERNKVMNLTAITDFEEVVVKHFLDSLCLIKVFPELSDQKILDLGTGAGFPGIPLKIAFPQINLTLMDSVNKKINFLSEVIDDLSLENAYAVHGRAEDLARVPKYRQQFDLCVSRAVANLSSLSEYCLPFVKIGGSFISYKSSDIEQEANDARKAVFLMGGNLQKIEKYRLPCSDITRSLVCIAKENGTSKIYPRKAGVPTKNPIN